MACTSSVQIDGAWIATKLWHVTAAAIFCNALVTAPQVMTSSVKCDGAWIATKLWHVGAAAIFATL
jgi:hypothetical protein